MPDNLENTAHSPDAAVDRQRAARLIKQLNSSNQHLREEADQRATAQGLTHLLPRLRADDTATLDVAAKRLMNHALTRPDVDLILAVLSALEQVGDASAIPNVRKLANKGGIAAKELRVQEAARACLPLLLARAEQQQSPQTLLRAASAESINSDTLLQPASGNVNAAPEQLLRAAPGITEEVEV
jgi:hypothetical protein